MIKGLSAIGSGSVAQTLVLGGWIVDYTLELDIKSAVIGLDAAADRNVSIVICEPKRKLPLLMIDEAVGPKEIGIDSHDVDTTKNCFHSFLLDDLNGNTIHVSTVADENLKRLSHREWLDPDEVDCRQDIL